MFEIVLLIVGGGVIAYSFFQAIRRGEVSEEDRAKNPTLIEGASSAVKILEVRAGGKHQGNPLLYGGI